MKCSTVIALEEAVSVRVDIWRAWQKKNIYIFCLLCLLQTRKWKSARSANDKSLLILKENVKPVTLGNSNG